MVVSLPGRATEMPFLSLRAGLATAMATACTILTGEGSRVKRVSLVFIRIYQVTIGPLFGMMSSCRYEPTCSHYGYESIQRFGSAPWLVARGSPDRTLPSLPRRWFRSRAGDVYLLAYGAPHASRSHPGGESRVIIAATTTTTSCGFNPLSIFSILQYPFIWVLQELVKIFTASDPLKAIGAFGLSVMVLTIAIRAVLFPVFGWQLRTSRRIQAEQRLVAPQLQELRKKYKKEPQRLSQEMNALYKEHGISPFSSLTGCIPALVQMPVLIGLYQSIKHFTGGGVLAPTDKGFLWISDVTQSAQQACCSAKGATLATSSCTRRYSSCRSSPAYSRSRSRE